MMCCGLENPPPKKNAEYAFGVLLGCQGLADSSSVLVQMISLEYRHGYHKVLPKAQRDGVSCMQLGVSLAQ